MPALVSFFILTVTKKYALNTSELKLVGIIRPQPRIAPTTKWSKEKIIWLFVEHHLKRRDTTISNNGQSIDEKHSSDKCFKPQG